ncbi:MAG: RNA polymerase sigma factor [Verrucomicrobiota bacterium]
MDRNELERIYDDHGAAVFGLFRRFVVDSVEAKDLMQDWVCKLAQSGVPSDLENERVWLLKVAYRMAVDWKRREGSRRHEAARAEWVQMFPSLRTEADPDREVMRLRIEEALVDLADDQRLVVEMKLWDGLGFREIGEVLEISTDTAASRYRYGTQKLREVLRPLYQELCE